MSAQVLPPLGSPGCDILSEQRCCLLHLQCRVPLVYPTHGRDYHQWINVAMQTGRHFAQVVMAALVVVLAFFFMPANGRAEMPIMRVSLPAAPDGLACEGLHPAQE